MVVESRARPPPGRLPQAPGGHSPSRPDPVALRRRPSAQSRSLCACAQTPRQGGQPLIAYQKPA